MMNKNWIDDRYEILEKLGSGGMGEVYKVLDKITQTTLALKISFPNLKGKNYLTFKKEFQTLASLSHPNILKVYDFGMIEDRRHYFTMEYIDGKDIYELFKSFSISHKPQYQLLYSIIHQICEALRFIHFRGLIHGDIKPNNIMIENGSSIAKLMDFGLVEETDLSKASKLRGTLNYIAPELLAGEKVDKRADFFSFGVTLYQILTHKMPFKGENPISLLKEYREKKPIPPQKLNQAIPIELNNLVLKLLEVEPQKRFENVDEIQKALSEILAEDKKPYLFKSHFIGREKEFDTLKKRYREVVNRNGRAVLILAENGTGKTRLAQEFKVYTELEGATFREIGFSSQKGKGVQPFVNLFIEEKHRKRIDIKDGLALFEEIINLFIDKAKNKPVFLLLEDIQLSDKSSIYFMKYLIRSIEKTSVFLVMTSEKSDKSFASTFMQDLEDIEHFSRIELNPLTPHQTFLQVKSILGTEYDIKDIGRFVYEKTEGNPFLIERFSQTLAENLCIKKIGDKWELIPENAKKLRMPKGVTQFVEASLQKLSKEEFRVLEIATILKDNFDLPALREISQISTDTLFKNLNILIWKGVIAETQSGKYTFTHKIVADLIEDKISPLKTLSLHKKASKVLEKKFKQNLEEVAGDIARHYLKSGEKRNAYHFAMMAGEKAKRAYANEEAIRQFEIALSLINEAGNKKKKVALLETVGDLHQLMGDSKKAILNYENALSLKQSEKIYRKIGKVYREQGNHKKEIEFLAKGLEIVKSENLYAKILLLTDIGWAYGQLNRHKEAMSHSLNAVNLAKKENNQDGLACAYNTLGSLYYQIAEWEKAIKYYKGELDIGEKISNEQHIAFSSCSLGLIYWKMGEWQLAEKFYKKSLEITEKKGDIHRTLDNYTALGILAQETNNLKKALDYHNKAFDISRKIGNREGVVHCHINLGRVYQTMGNWTKALQGYENGLSVSKRIENNTTIIECYLNLGDLYRVKGDYDKSLKNLKQSLNIARKIDDKEKMAYAYRSIGEVLQDKGDWEEASKFLIQSLKIYEKIEAKQWIVRTTLALANTYVNIGDLALAENYCQKAVTLSQKIGDKLQLGLATCVLGTIYSNNNKIEQSLKSFATSIDISKNTSDKYGLGKTLLTAANEIFQAGMKNPEFTKKFWREGHLDEALKRLEEAKKIFKELNAKGEIKKIENITNEIKKYSSSLLGTLPGENKRLKTLYRMSQIINSIIDIDELLSKILDLTIEVMGAERGFILYKGNKGALKVKVARNMDHQSIKDMSDLSKSIMKNVAFKGKLILTSDARNDSRFRDRKSIANFKLLSIICVPLRLKKDIIGTIYIDDRRKEGTFTENDLEFLKSFANQSGMAIENARLVEELKKAKRNLEEENIYLKQVVESRYTFDKIIGKSESMQRVYRILEKIIDYSSSVVIEGETGTGKELIANAIHYNSPRKDKRFVAINCGALPEHLLESELFGHIKGAFTGAIKDKEGLFEVADGGTVFLDEIGQLGQNLQAKLLRILQNGETRKVGSTKYKKIDVRLISATNKNLAEAIEKKEFRKDLYYRLNIISVKLPPLRDRKKDIPLLAEHFLSKIRKSIGKDIKGFTKGAMSSLLNYHWEGNVRELENVIERAIIMAEKQMITVEDFPDKITKKRFAKRRGEKKITSLPEIEREHISEILNNTKWRKSKAAKILDISRPTLDKKIEEYNIK